jgi:hypothetical protein
MEAEGTTALEVITRQRLMKIQQTEELVRAVVNCRTRESVIALELIVVTIYKCHEIQLPIETASIVTYTRDNIMIYPSWLGGQASFFVLIFSE